MTSTTEQYGPDRPEDRYRVDGGAADVVDLSAARVRLAPDTQPDTAPDIRPDTVPDIADPVLEGEVLPPLPTPADEGWLPIIPVWMQSKTGIRNMVRLTLRRWWYRIRFTAVRLPWATVKWTGRAVRGSWRISGRLLAWALDTRADAMEQELATGARQDAKEFIRVREDRARRIRARLVVLGLATLVGAGGGAYLWFFTPRLVQVLVAMVLVTILARVGANPDTPLIGPAMATSSGYLQLSDAILMRALNAAGLGGTVAKVDRNGETTEEGNRPTLAQPLQRENAGYLAMVDLPFGKTVADATKGQAALASGLDVDEVQVFVENVRGSARRVSIYVADEDPFMLPPRRSPLARLPRVSVWNPNPLGADVRGREVCPSLIFNSFLIGAIPRSGKTYAGRALVAPGFLDPHCDVTVLDFKGGKDWQAAEQLAVTFRLGDDDEDLGYAIGALQNLKGEAQNRFKAFRAMSDEQNPEGKLTPELAKAGYRPHLIVLDEVQNLLRAPEKEIRDEALALLVWLAKTAPAAGFTLVMATQRPATDVIPSDLRDNTSVRLALRTKTWQSSDAILGSGINAIGFGTQRFLEEHKGAAILGGVSNGRGGDLQVIRTDLLKNSDFTQICQIGAQRRADAGTLRGHAVGQAEEIVVTVTILSDVVAVWPGVEPKVQAKTLVERLQEAYPSKHAHLDQTSLTKALKDHGVPVVQVYRDGSNRNGYALAAVRKALAKAEGPDITNS
ncbi:hypothetical protein [Cryptosporangium arvum]|uniref:DNA segregation ATPase, FtsK/SpoIIIE family n=1 Tax=Cryptosporangium arvum DSM 44712 TaxID=927661 RepID=A0A010ZPL7_9ACTN|nr:hypothetical protein [Cryptosporangium arvum]EXG79167.1 DNA segregation ATPase, FtsK/SpoIIIE family [Cryptosporangium arvum DSM 44712]